MIKHLILAGATGLLASAAVAEPPSGSQRQPSTSSPSTSSSASTGASAGQRTPGSTGSEPAGTTGGSAGTASIDGTSASSLGVGATSDGSNAMGVAGSAAAADGHTLSQSHVNPNATNGVAHSMANDRGTFSKSMTHTRIHKGQVYSRTRTMTHRPGSKPTITTTTSPTGTTQR